MKQGFTLIELLIVIAIILILIAIALPNFLSAQARAKVVREEADMRTLATAIESLRLEYGFLLVDFWDDDVTRIVISRFRNLAVNPEPARFAACCAWHNWNRRGGTTGLFTPLTTPISYLTEVPRDPFAFERGDQHLISEDVIPPVSYMYHDRELSDERLNASPWQGVPAQYLPENVTGAHGIQKPLSQDHYLLVGFGPDAKREHGSVIPYNPTNGTRSFGDVIFRSDGGI